ncbi:hypothetical protein GX441_07275, partial [bacterium]|nr:hypothetical protein [bacterium]
MEDALTLAASGDYDVDIEIDEKNIDALTAIETGVKVLITDLGTEVIESRKRAEELEEKLDLIEQQRKAIEELSTPIIKIWDQVLVLPLIGTLDTRRSQRLTE